MGEYKHEVTLELAPVPMKPASLIHVVMPALVRVAVGKEGYFTIGYSPIRGDRISAIQAASSGKELHVEGKADAAASKALRSTPFCTRR